MEEPQTCPECKKPVSELDAACPHCGHILNPNIPNYPRMGGGAFMVIWIFFVSLVVIMIVTWLTMGN